MYDAKPQLDIRGNGRCIGPAEKIVGGNLEEGKNTLVESGRSDRCACAGERTGRVAFVGRCFGGRWTEIVLTHVP